MEFQASLGKESYQVVVTETESGHLQLMIGDKSYLVDVATPVTNLYSLLIAGKSYAIRIEEGGGATLLVTLDQQTWPIEILEKQHLLRSKKPTHLVSGRQEITAPMTGRIVDVLVEEGEEVAEGKTLLIIEAMKMETEIHSPGAGTVREVRVKQDMAVEMGQVLMVVE